MPKKIRELKQMLKKAGFSQRTGKGSHSNWFHPLYPGRITIAVAKAVRTFSNRETYTE